MPEGNGNTLREALTFDDVLLEPKYSTCLPSAVDLTTQLTEKITLHIPVLSAAMDKVTEAPTAIAMARAGGVGVVHRNLSIEKQVLEVKKVKKSESGMILDPIRLHSQERVRTAIELIKKHGISGFPITEGSKLVGILTNRDIRFEEDLERPVQELMTPIERVVTARENVSRKEAIRLMHRHRIEKLPIVNAQGELHGLITIKDIQKSIAHPFGNRDEQGRLRVGAAVGTGDDSRERSQALAEALVDFIVIDTAHGASKNVLEMLRWLKKQLPEMQVVAGNVATGEGAKCLYDAGADAVKVGMGCGSICTTRVVTGVGVPQFSAVRECIAVAHDYGRPLIADGGMRYSGDVAKALAAGAHAVMIGNMLAGTEEAPGEIVFYQGRTYKSYRGMGSLEAMRQGSRDRYGQADYDETQLVPEGIEGMVPFRGSLAQVLHQLVGGVQAACGYLGAHNLKELRENACFVKVTGQGFHESHVHDVFVVKEAPNYRPNE